MYRRKLQRQRKGQGRQGKGAAGVAPLARARAQDATPTTRGIRRRHREVRCALCARASGGSAPLDESARPGDCPAMHGSGSRWCRARLRARGWARAPRQRRCSLARSSPFSVARFWRKKHKSRVAGGSLRRLQRCKMCFRSKAYGLSLSGGVDSGVYIACCLIGLLGLLEVSLVALRRGVLYPRSVGCFDRLGSPFIRPLSCAEEEARA